jgi:DNA polymerase III alpha subunit
MTTLEELGLLKMDFLGLKDGFRHITDKHGNNKLTG